MQLRYKTSKKRGSMSERVFAKVRFGEKPMVDKPISEKVDEIGQEMLRKYPPYCEKKKNVCLIIGPPGSGAKRFLITQKKMLKDCSEVLFYETLFQAEREIHGALSLETPIDTFLIYGYFQFESDSARWENFLTRIPIKHAYSEPLCHYVPDIHNHPSGTVVKLTKKDGYWLLQMLQAEDHRVLF